MKKVSNQSMVCSLDIVTDHSNG